MRNGAESCEEGRDLPDSPWVVDIREKIKQGTNDATSFLRKKSCIYRVPRRLRERDPKAYSPQLVSLGPYHHGNPELREMESRKWCVLAHVLERDEQDVKLYLDAVAELEEEARSCYDGKIDFDKNQFVEMMVVDAIFVLEFFLFLTKLQSKKPNDPLYDILFPEPIATHILVDMIKLENQLPLLILGKLLGIRLGDQNPNRIPIMIGEVAKLITPIFCFLSPTFGPPVSCSSDGENLNHTSRPISVGEDLHCLDVFRKDLLKIKSPEKVCCCLATTATEGEFIHCATELKEAGVKLKEKKTSCFWDITFQNGILEIPQLRIDDYTKLLFLNFIAFEQCHPRCGDKITSYASFMDNLINSEQDVVYLHKHKIIEHWLGSDAEVATMFNDLCNEVVYNQQNYLAGISCQINQYSEHKCNVWGASLKRKYFSNPWSIISLLAAIVLLLLTLLQTIYAGKDYYHPQGNKS